MTKRMELKKLRRLLGVKLEIIAALSGVSAGTISRALNGKRDPGPEVLDKIERTLKAIAKVREGFAAAPLDLTDVKWLRAKIKELDEAVVRS
jgi:transcriptional regulator with XRE-family HTH domain